MVRIHLRFDPAMTLGYGTTFGVVGVGLVILAKKNVDRAFSAFGLTDIGAPPTD